MKNNITLSGAILKVSNIKADARAISCDIKIDCGTCIVDCKVSSKSIRYDGKTSIAFRKFSEKILIWKYAATPELATLYGFLNSEGCVIITYCGDFRGPKAELDLEATVDEIGYFVSFSAEVPDGNGKVTIFASIDKNLEDAFYEAGLEIGSHSTFYFDITETGYELVGCLPLT